MGTRGAPGWFGWLSVRFSISAQVMILQFVGSNPTSGSALIVWSLLGILSLPLSLSLPLPHSQSLALYLSLSQKKYKIKKKLQKRQNQVPHCSV